MHVGGNYFRRRREEDILRGRRTHGTTRPRCEEKGEKEESRRENRAQWRGEARRRGRNFWAVMQNLSARTIAAKSKQSRGCVAFTIRFFLRFAMKQPRGEGKEDGREMAPKSGISELHQSVVQSCPSPLTVRREARHR